ncbi:hypothetical protein ACQ86G_29630 [Roseateles chitinivorans]|uniref:hypothetical protein n=1 Tax=Roseateles chitinivorans TaxID=2917965 RepID=UPI003D67C1CE
MRLHRIRFNTRRAARLAAAAMMALLLAAWPPLAGAQPVWRLDRAGQQIFLIGTKLTGSADDHLTPSALKALEAAERLYLQVEDGGSWRLPPAWRGTTDATFQKTVIHDCERWNPLDQADQGTAGISAAYAVCLQAFASELGQEVRFGTEPLLVEAFRRLGKGGPLRSLQSPAEVVLANFTVPVEASLRAAMGDKPTAGSVARDLAREAAAFAAPTDAPMTRIALEDYDARHADPVMLERLVEGPNSVYVARIVAAAGDEPIAVAMDYTRLFGPHGVLKKLSRAGFAVTRLPAGTPTPTSASTPPRHRRPGIE